MRLYFGVIGKGDELAGQVFNIGGGVEESLSLLELFALLESITGGRLNYSRLPVRQSDQKVFIADISKAYKLLSWKPKVGCKEGVMQMMRWVERFSIDK